MGLAGAIVPTLGFAQSIPCSPAMITVSGGGSATGSCSFGVLQDVAKAMPAGSWVEFDGASHNGVVAPMPANIVACLCHGANSGQGGNGGAIYNDGNEIVMNLTSSLIENNMANEGGSAIFFVSNDRSGSITITDSITRNNPRGAFETPDLPGFYVLANGPAQVINSQILR